VSWVYNTTDKENMLKDKVAYNSYMKEYMKKRYYSCRSKAIEYLGGKCVVCDSADSLEFDHIIRDSRSFDIADYLMRPWNILVKELDKCQLLCSKHHDEKSLKELGRTSAVGTHGTLSSGRYCNCSLCKKAKADYNREYGLRKKMEH
jgi:hypothetical protein